MATALWCDKCKTAGHICAPDWLLDDGAGPPTLEDDAWFTQYVASLGYPKVKRDPAPMEGQSALFDMSSAEIDRRMMAALDEEREWADEQRAREAEAEQWRDHRPE